MTKKFQPDDLIELLTQFQIQLDKVEKLMNESMRPLICKESPLDEQGIQQALEILERWAELYSYGLSKAPENIYKNGKKWLYEAHKRLAISSAILEKIDIKSEKILAQNRIDKAKYLQKNIARIERIIAPVIEQIKLKS